MDLTSDSPSWEFARERRDQLQWPDDAFIESPTFPVASLRYPELHPAWIDHISSGSFSQGRWGEPPVRVEGIDEVTLLFGAVGGAGGSGVTVSTGLFGRWGGQPQPLVLELAKHHARVDPSRQDPFLHDLPSHSGVLRIAGATHDAEIGADAGSWVARTRLPLGQPDPMDRLVIVTVAATGVEENELQLDWVHDLRRFADEKRRLDDAEEREVLGRVAAVAAALPADLDVHRALIEEELGLVVAGLELGGQAANDPTMHEARRAALGHAAIEAQARLRGQDMGQATAAISSMLAHMRALAAETAWFRTDPTLRKTAISETVAFVARGKQVPSQAAQQAWGAYQGGLLSRFFGASSGSRGRALPFPDPSDLIPEPERELFARMRDAVRDPTTVTPEEGRALAERLRYSVRNGPAPRQSPHDRWLGEWELWAVDRRREI